jgi:hypothetical protein
MVCYRAVIRANGTEIYRHAAVVEREEERKESQYNCTAAVDSFTGVCPAVLLQ